MRKWIVFTDLDGTLLDADTFGLEPARPILRRLREAGIPLVPVTSKTLAEVVPLAAELGCRHAIVESGGAIVRLEGGQWVVEAQGPAADLLRAAAEEIERRTGSRLRLYSRMPKELASSFSGLTGDSLSRSRDRAFDEPFILEEGDIEAVSREAGTLGLTVLRGGRFEHLCGPRGKGDAVRKLREEIGADAVSVALGDAPMDADILVPADIPIIVPRPDGKPHPDLVARVPHARVAPAPGPAGWSAAVGEVWTEMAERDA